MRFRVRVVAAALLAGAAAPVAAAPNPSHFQACDGYGKPTENGDGMTKEAIGLLGIFTAGPSAGDTRRVEPPLGPDGVAACTNALADPRMLDKHWARKVSLLRARAVHRLALGQSDFAMTDLDAAKAAVREPTNPYFVRSLGLGLDLVRAYALRQQDRAAEANAIVAKVILARPFNRETAASLLAIVPDPRALVNGEPILLPLARLQPKFIDSIFTEAFRTRDFATAIAIYPHVTAPLRVGDRGVASIEANVQRERNFAADQLFTANRRAMLAYARAATGDSAGARRDLDSAEGILLSMRPMAPLPAGTKEGRNQRALRALNGLAVAAAKQSAEGLKVWRGMVDARVGFDQGRIPASFTELPKLIPNAAALDLLTEIHARNPSFSGAGGAIADLEKRLRPEIMKRDEEVKLLFASLPHAEIAQRIATYRKANSDLAGYFWGGISGFKTKPNGDGTTTVIFTGQKSSGGVVEEMALLRAADLAREQGKTGLVIRERADFERTQNNIMYGYTVSTVPLGYSTELTVEFVDKSNLPPQYRSAQWRVLDVAQILSQLGPTYWAAPAAKQASSTR